LKKITQHPLLTIEQNRSPLYIVRTQRNIMLSDCTLGFVTNPNTAGMQATARTCDELKKGIIMVEITAKPLKSHLKRRGDEIAEVLYQTYQTPLQDGVMLNIAGNGVYETVNSGVDQQCMDKQVYEVLKRIAELLGQRGYPVLQIRSGGQSGADTAGLRAGVRLGIPTVGHYPYGYKVRTVEGVDKEHTYEEILHQILSGIPAK